VNIMSNHNPFATVFGSSLRVTDHYETGLGRKSGADLEVRRVNRDGVEEVQIEVKAWSDTGKRRNTQYVSMSLTPEIARLLVNALSKTHPTAPAMETFGEMERRARDFYGFNKRRAADIRIGDRIKTSKHGTHPVKYIEKMAGNSIGAIQYCFMLGDGVLGPDVYAFADDMLDIELPAAA
jgi:hypothetical protein